MDVVSSIYLSSVAGAALFFAGGRLWGRVRDGGTPGSYRVAEQVAREGAEERERAASLARDDAMRALVEERSLSNALRHDIASARTAREKHDADTTLLVQSLKAETTNLRAALSERMGAAEPPSPPGAEGAELAKAKARVTAAESHAEAANARAKAAEGRASAAESHAKAADLRAKTAEDHAKAADLRTKTAEDHLKSAELRAKAAEDHAKTTDVRVKGAEERAKMADARAKAAEDQAKAADVRAKSAEDRARTDDAWPNAMVDASKIAEDERVKAAEVRASSAEKRAVAIAAQAEQLRGRLGEATAARIHLEEAMAAMNREHREKEAQVAAADTAVTDAPRLRLENDHLRRALDALEKERSANPDRAELQRRSLELSLKARVIEQRTQEFENKDAENAALRQKVEAHADAMHEVALLRAKVRDLEARGFADGIRASWKALLVPSQGRDGRLEKRMVEGLEALLASESGGTSAVLSDMRGLLIAAAGDTKYQDELAAAASFTTFTAERLQQLLPLGEAMRLTIVDENAVVFSTRWLRWAGESFLLCTLGPAEETADPRIEAFREALAGLLG